MNDDGTLLVMSQIALGFVGFGAIVTALQSKAVADWPELDRLRFWSFLIGGMTGIFFAILPKIVFGLTIDIDLTWRISSFLYAALQASLVVRQLTIVWPILRKKAAGTNTLRRYLVLSLAIFNMTILFLNGTGLLFNPQYGVYLLALSITLCLSAFHFTQLLRFMGQGTNEE
jgi:hypothetical protein